MFPSVVEQDAPAVQRLRQAAALQAAAEAAQAQALLDLATEAEWDETAEFDMHGTRPLRIGADGTRLVDEHLPLEVAAALGISATAAIWLIRDILNLAARHPRLWQTVQARLFPLWRARTIAQLVEAASLNQEEAHAVDALIADAVGRVGWRRLCQRLRTAMLQVAPDRLRAQAEASQATRYIRLGTLSDDPATSYLAGRLDTSVARDFDDLLNRVADGLSARGETGDRDLLRSQAIGAIATDPGAVADLLDCTVSPAVEPTGTHPKPAKQHKKRRPHQLYVHLPATLGPNAVADIETMGPVLADQLGRILGDRPIKLTPVLHLADGAEPVADSYQIPQRVREHVLVRDRFDIFPYSTHQARGCDLDHTAPYVDGVPRQTRPSNLGPLTRRAHRAKTHGGWQLHQPCPGVFWWTTPHGQIYRVTPDGTTNLTPGDPIADCSDAERQLQWRLDHWRGS